MGEFEVEELGKLLSEKGYIRGPFGSALRRGEMVDTGIPVYEQKNAIYNDRTFRYFITPDKFEELKRFQVHTNDLIISCSGTVGQISIISEDDPKGIISQALLILRPDVNQITLKFLYYFLTSRMGLNLITQATHGSVQVNIAARKVVETIPIPIPSLPEQKAIAGVLSSLDDKIDLLHRQNKTLEAMAETLFRQWFIEEAQDDWEEKSILDVIQLIGGGTPKTTIAEYWGGNIPWLAGGDIASNHKSFVNHSTKYITEYGLNNSSAKLLPQYATVITARGTVGKYCLLGKPMTFSQTNYGILPTAKISECFFFTYLLINNIVEELHSSAYGSVFDTITTSTFKEIQVPLPKEADIQVFEQLVYIYFMKMFLNKKQIHTLEKLRDTLLPKLMSGEIRILFEDA